MKAIVQHGYGTPNDVLKLAEGDTPAVGDQRCWCGCAMVRRLGADHVIDYTTRGISTVPLATTWKQPLGVQIADQRNSGCLNAQLYAAAAQHETLKIIRWASFLWPNDPSYRIRAYLADGAHTSALGMAARNPLIVPLVQPLQSP
jgi:hypothetical protein